MIEEPSEKIKQPVWKFLAKLRERGLEVSSEEGRLRVSARPGVLTTELRGELVERKLEILDFLQELAAASEQRAPALRAISRDQPLELSFAQQRLWMLDQMAPGRSEYHVNVLMRLEGPLCLAALKSAISELVRRHEALRTSFPTIDGRPVQEIACVHEPDIKFVDLSGLRCLEQKEEDALCLAREEGSKPYDLAKGPLTRWQLYRLDAELHVLWSGMHHIITDGWSLRVIRSELAELYDAAVAQRAPSLEHLPLQYADFAAWQRNWLSGKALQRQLDYWKAHLAGLSVLELPADRPPPSEPTFQGLSERIMLGREALARLKELANAEGATLFMTLLAAFQALLQRYTGQDDIVVGSPIANRTRSEIEGLVGFFVNSLVLRADLSGDPTFREALRRVREITLKAYEFQDVPFEKLVEELAPERSAGRNPFFQIMFALQNLPTQDEMEAGGLKITLAGSKGRRSRFDLEVHLWDANGELQGQLVYCTDRFDAPRIARLVAHYERILQAASLQPDQRLSSLEMLTFEERERLLIQWNQTASEYPKGQRIEELFEQQVRRDCGAVAVVCGESSLSYEELNGRANQFAAYLRARGVHTGTRVAICMERSTEMVCAMLGILKAGAVYVPLDSSYPKERLNFMIKDAEAPFVVIAEASESELAETGAKVISLLSDWPFIEACSREDVRCQPAESDDLAYVIYTSGSTGTPKGVAVPHRAIARLVFNANYVDLGPDDGIAHLSNVCFDAATFEIWGALLSGARLIVISKEVALDPEAFAIELKNRGVTTLFLTTALFNELAAWNGNIFQSVKQVLFGGEAVNPRWVQHVLETGPPQRLLHVYGPTECTTFATFYPINHLSKDATTIPIGRPLSNTTAYVLDKNRNPLPIGVPGELYLGGPGLAQGYLNRPELTREKFIDHRIGNDQRLYRTGDIVKYLPDGDIEFIGRADNQVKIRGFRIEPGEVEAVLRRNGNVEDAVVIVREDQPGERQLVAYIVSRNGAAPDDWREFLQSKLPAYMIPSAFVEIDTLPMTASGKVNRMALPKPRRAITQRGIEADRTPTEQIVSNVWANLLCVDEMSTQENFFELGGHSLLAVQIVMALRRALQIDIPVAALFTNPTISSFSRHLDDLTAQNLGTVRPPINKVSRDQPLPLSFAQERLWRNERIASSPDNINVVILDLKGDLKVSCLERSFQELMRRHEVFRTTFHVVGDAPILHIAPDRPDKLHVVDLSHSPNADEMAERLALKEKTDVLNLEHGPLMRFSLLRFGTLHHRLVIRLHHILYDLWALPTFFRELDALYSAYCLGKDSPLPELTVQLADFAVWQRHHLAPDSSTFRTLFAYWKKQLSGNLPVLKLPSERVSPLMTATSKEAIFSFEMSEELSADLRVLTRQQGTTLFITFLSALKALINISTGQNDIMLGIYMAKRNASECEGMMGYFCEVGALRTAVSSDLSFLQLLGRVRETFINAHAHEDMPFDRLGEELTKCGQTPPDLRAIFTFETFAQRALRLGDLEVAPLGVTAHDTMPWRFQMRVRDEGKVFSGLARFDTRLHDPHRVRRMMHSYIRLLQLIGKKPSARLCELEEELGTS